MNKPSKDIDVETTLRRHHDAIKANADLLRLQDIRHTNAREELRCAIRILEEKIEAFEDGAKPQQITRIAKVCQNCTYWQYEAFPAPEQDIYARGQAPGFCKRRSPTAMPPDGLTYFARILSGDWCGEFIKK